MPLVVGGDGQGKKEEPSYPKCFTFAAELLLTYHHSKGGARRCIAPREPLVPESALHYGAGFAVPSRYTCEPVAFADPYDL